MKKTLIFLFLIANVSVLLSQNITTNYKQNFIDTITKEYNKFAKKHTKDIKKAVIDYYLKNNKLVPNIDSLEICIIPIVNFKRSVNRKDLLDTSLFFYY